MDVNVGTPFNQSESVAEEIKLEYEEKLNEIEPEKKDQTVSVTKEDPFAYLDRDDFTSEKYKIEIRNLPKHYGISVSTNCNDYIKVIKI